MIEMVSGKLFQGVGCCRIACLTQGDDGCMVAEFQVIALLDHEIGRILHPHIITKSPFLVTLQGRTIESVGSTVVLPCNVIDTFRILASAHPGLHGTGLTGDDGEASCTLRAHAGFNEQLAIVGQLVGHFLMQGIDDTELGIGSDTELLTNKTGIHFHEFLTLVLSRISNGYR